MSDGPYILNENAYAYWNEMGDYIRNRNKIKHAVFAGVCGAASLPLGLWCARQGQKTLEHALHTSSEADTCQFHDIAQRVRSEAHFMYGMTAGMGLAVALSAVSVIYAIAQLLKIPSYRRKSQEAYANLQHMDEQFERRSRREELERELFS